MKRCRTEDTQYSQQQAVVLASASADGYEGIPLDLESARLGALSGSSVITVHQSAEAGSTCAECGEFRTPV